MRITMFIMSLAILACTSVMLYGVITRHGPVYKEGIIAMTVALGLSIALVKITYDELRNKK
jgi:hypothetical protein